MNDLTVILAACGDCENINKSIFSLLHQNYSDFDIVVISETPLSLGFEENDRLKFLVSKSFSSQSELLNKIVSETSTEYISFLACGDMLFFDAILRRYELMKRKDYYAVYGLGFEVDKDLELEKNDLYEKFFSFADFPEITLENILKQEIRPELSSFFIRRDIFCELKFDEAFSQNFVWEFFLRLFKKYHQKIFLMKEPIYLSYLGEFKHNCFNRNSIVRYLDETHKVFEDHFGADFSPESLELENECCQNSYWISYFFIKKYFENDVHMFLQLMSIYIKRYIRHKHDVIDFRFLSMVINSFVNLKINLCL